MTDIEQSVRASSLGNLASCSLLWTASRFRKRVTAVHPDVVWSPFDFKPAMGTALHLVHELGTPDEGLADEIERSLQAEAQDKPPEDFFTSEKYPDLDSMVNAVVAMTRVFRASSHSAPWTTDRDNSTFETKVEVGELFGEKLPIMLTGTIDLLHDTGEGRQVVDLKTTAMTDGKTLHQAQVTAYRGMAEEVGAEMRPDAKIVKIERPRTPKFRVPPKVRAYSIDTRPHEKRVVHLVRKAADILEREDQWKDDFSRIPANPYSAACAYCDLRSTSACPATRFESIPDANAKEES